MVSSLNALLSFFHKPFPKNLSQSSRAPRHFTEKSFHAKPDTTWKRRHPWNFLWNWRSLKPFFVGLKSAWAWRFSANGNCLEMKFFLLRLVLHQLSINIWQRFATVDTFALVFRACRWTSHENAFLHFLPSFQSFRTWRRRQFMTTLRRPLMSWHFAREKFWMSSSRTQMD